MHIFKILNRLAWLGMSVSEGDDVELAYNLRSYLLFSSREGIPELVMQIKGDPELDF